MATYVQGVSNVIPQIQPFQPDLNFYANTLQTKQNQYDKNWKQLSNMYGQFYYADLTRDSNIEKKENLIKNIDFNLKRVAGLDLSLEQNTAQAAQVFKPFYEDKVLMKDMAWTKNYMTNRGRATGLKNSDDEKMRSQYWDVGLRSMDYRREEFKETSDEESMGFGNVSYTPYMNVNKEALKIAKDAGLSIESVDFSPDGKWIIKKKNGQPLMAPLQKLFESTLGKDPRVMDIYKTQSYVNRKDYSYNNAAQFNGDKNAAELDYLEKNFTMLRDRNAQQRKELQNESNVNQNRQQDVEEQIKNGDALPGAGSYLESLQEAQGINDAVLEESEKLNETLSNGSSTLSTSTGFQNPYGDLKSLRQKVDAGMASMLMQKDLGEAAYIYAHRDMKMDIDANPYKVLEIKQANRMSAIKAKGAMDQKNLALKHGLKAGTFFVDPNGDIQRTPGVWGAQNYSVEDGSTDEQDLTKVEQKVMEEEYENSPEILVKEVLNMVKRGREAGTVSDEDVKAIFGYDIDLKKFEEGVQKEGGEYISKLTSKYSGNDKDDTYLGRLANRADAWMRANKDLDVVKSSEKQIRGRVDDAVLFGDNMKAYNDWKRQVKDVVISKLEGSGINPSSLFDDNNNLLDKEQFIQKLDLRKDNTAPSMGRMMWNSAIAPLEAMFTDETAATLTAQGMQDVVKYVQQLDRSKYKSSGRWTDPQTFFKSPHDIVQTAIEGVYEDAFTKATGLMSNSNTYKTVGKMPYLGAYGKGSGLTSTGVQYTVPPKAFGTPSHGVWMDFARKFSATDIDRVNTVLSTEGRSKFAFNNAVDDPDMQKQLEGIMNALIAESQLPTTTLKPFTIKAQAIAASDADKSAITVVPGMDFLQKYVKGGEKEDRDALINQIATNGISLIGDSESNIFDTQMLNDLYSDPITSLVQTNGSYSYKNPQGLGEFKVTQNELSPSGMQYEASFWTGGYDNEGNMTFEKRYDNVLSGQNLLNQQETLNAIWTSLPQQYKQVDYGR